MPVFVLRRSIERLGERYLETLLETNTERVVNDFNDRARESEARLQDEIRQRLGTASASAEHALAVARETFTRGRPAVESGLSQLDNLNRALEAVVAEAPYCDESNNPRKP